MSWEDFVLSVIFGLSMWSGFAIGNYTAKHDLANKHCAAISDRHEFKACKEEFLK